MPFMRNGHRDYAAEARWEKTTHPQRVKERAERNSARARMMKKGLVHKGDGKHVDHVRELVRGGSNANSNLRVVSAHTNLEKEAHRKQKE
jgi:hypothetical protein